jgi:hypothetical protein
VTGRIIAYQDRCQMRRPLPGADNRVNFCFDFFLNRLRERFAVEYGHNVRIQL